MSPLVQRPRTPAAPKRPNDGDQFWGMLLFESLSAGVLAVGLGLATVLAVFMLYAVLIWPLTFWDLTNLGLEQYASWTDTVLWSIFAAGTLAGYWYFSGAAFKNNPKTRGTVRPTRGR